MPPTPPIALTPARTSPTDPAFQALLSWPFASDPFYERQVLRLLQQDIPHRWLYGSLFVWLYNDPAGQTVGFGALDVCREYQQFTSGKDHGYIPVLAVNPKFQGRGHGRTIVEHLTTEAALCVQGAAGLSEFLFLDVYVANQRAIDLYVRCGFTVLNPDLPIADPDENQEPYFIMARNVSIVSS
ncbi:MAG: N-acetyltransferase [Gemmataceae bacterium]